MIALMGRVSNSVSLIASVNTLQISLIYPYVRGTVCCISKGLLGIFRKTPKVERFRHV